MRGRPSRPSPLQWLWYAYGGGLPRELSPWVLDDATRRTWIVRHVARALAQLLPVVVACLFVPVPFGYRFSAAFGGLVICLLWNLAFMTEAIEHRVVKAGYAPGLAASLREERSEREQLERRSPYRRDGSGSFD